jgi:hypothetical protein
MLRAILIALFAGVLGTQAAADGLEVGRCPDRQYVIDYMTLKYPGVTVEPITGVEALAVKAAIKDAKATEFLVFAKPNSGDRRIIIGFVGGCLENAAPVTQGTIDRWLKRQGAAR